MEPAADPNPMQGTLTITGSHLPESPDRTLPAPPPSSVPSALALLKALRRRWLRALSLGLLCTALAGAAAWYLLPAKYTARAELRITSNDPIIFEGREHREDYLGYVATQAALIKSRKVLNAALQQPKVAALAIVRAAQPEAEEWLEKQLKVISPPDASEVLYIALSGDSPEELATLVNAVTDAYRGAFGPWDQKQLLDRLGLLQRIYDEYDQTLRAKWQKIEKIAKANDAANSQTLTRKQQLMLGRLELAKTALMQVELDRLRNEANLNFRQEQKKLPDRPVAAVSIAKELETDEQVRSLRKNIAAIEEEIKTAKKNSAPGALERNLKSPLERLDKAKELLAERLKELRPGIESQVREQARDDLDWEILRLQQENASLKEQEKAFRKRVESLEEETRSVGKSSVAMQSLEDDIMLSEVGTVAKKLAFEIQKVKVELRGPARVRLIAPAAVPQTQDLKPRLQGTGIAAALALGLVLLGISWREFQVRRITTADEVVQQVGMRVVGTLPDLPPSARHRPAGANAQDRYWHGLLLESVDAMRTMLLHAARAESLRVVMVTSALSGEGKTSLAGHLAASLARAGHKTLLVDGDLRRPAVHQVFDLSPAPGFSEWLRGEADIADVIQPTRLSGLAVICAGASDSRAREALARERLRTIFDRLKEQGGFVVIDSSPILPVADSLMIGQQADAVIFSILRHVSRMPTVYVAYQRLASLGIRILGAVVSGVRSDSYGYGYQNLAQSRG